MIDLLNFGESNNRSITGHHSPLWPPPHTIAELRSEGFALLALDTVYMREKQSHAEGDAWAIAFPDAERRVLLGIGRTRCLALLKTIRDRNLVADTPHSSNGKNMYFIAHLRLAIIIEKQLLQYSLYLFNIVKII